MNRILISRETGFWIVLAIFFVMTVIAGFLKPANHTADEPISFCSEPNRIMGTTCQLVIIYPPKTRGNLSDTAIAQLNDAENQIRQLETVFSTWINNSEISLWNAANATGKKAPHPVSRHLQAVLTASEVAFDQTGGAFDVHCSPILNLWKEAARTNTSPTEDMITRARNDRSHVELSGIAKGYCIDQALQTLIKNTGKNHLQPMGAVVDIGGDLTVWGTPANTEQRWTFRIIDPFFPQNTWGSFSIPPTVSQTSTDTNAVRSVCTSGHYYRGFNLNGTWLSHIIDPRTGRALQSGPGTPASVTVMANDCMTADYWATALAVLGTDGLKLLPKDVHAYMIIGTPKNHETVQSDHFPPVTLTNSTP